MQIFDQFLRMVNGRVQVLVRDLPAAIEVAASKGATIVAVDDAIGIKHRNDFENVPLSEHLGFLVLSVC